MQDAHHTIRFDMPASEAGGDDLCSFLFMLHKLFG